MKAVKKIFISLILLIASVSVFAQDASLKLLKTKKMKPLTAVVVGKIKVIYDEDRNFYAETFSIPEKRLNAPDCYQVPYPMKENQNIERNNLPLVRTNGDYFYDFCWIMNDKIRYNAPFSFFMFQDPLKIASEKLLIYFTLPIKFVCNVPKGEQYLYVGTIVYHVTGPNFEISRIEILDEYDEAVEDFKKVAGNDKQLCRALLETY